MKSDGWLTQRIIKESIRKNDVAFIRRLVQQGRSDDEILRDLRKRMYANSEGMREYIRHEKIRALMVKLTARIHWVCLLPVIKTWISEKEALIRWRENDHIHKIAKKTRELKSKLMDSEYKRMKLNCANGEGMPEQVMEMIENAAVELLSQIEKEEADVLQSGNDSVNSDSMQQETPDIKTYSVKEDIAVIDER